MRQATHKFNRRFVSVGACVGVHGEDSNVILLCYRLWGITAQLLTQLLTINRSRMEAWLLRSQAYLNMV